MSEHVPELLKSARTPLMSLMRCDIHVINPKWRPHALNTACIIIFIDSVYSRGDSRATGEMHVQHMKFYILCPFFKIYFVI